LGGLDGASSEEFLPELSGPIAHPVIHLMPSQEKVRWKGATMRLGSYPCTIRPNTLAMEVYGTASIDERHRHRYEVNNDYRGALSENGMVFSGVSPDNVLVEIIELPRSVHPYFIASQFHPELKSRPNRAHPLFAGLIRAALARPAAHANGAGSVPVEPPPRRRAAANGELVLE
jgi:CTP synthase